MNDASDNYVRVFVSHKSDDQVLAYKIRDILEKGCLNLRCYVAGQDYGEPWRETIAKEIERSSVLILLFTTPGKEWDWPLYEAGLFTPRSGEKHKYTLYFYLGKERPKPLEYLHGIRVDTQGLEGLKNFLRRFYRTSEIIGTEPPLYPKITDKELSARAGAIKRVFLASASKPIYPTYRIVLQSHSGRDDPIDSPGNMIPRDCSIESATPHALSIFAIADTDVSWQQIIDSIEDQDHWKHELDEQYQRALTGKIAYPTKSTFRGVGDTRHFRAMLTRLERAENRVIRASITFVPEPTPAVIGGPAFNLLRIATRFQYEVLNQYKGKLMHLCNIHGVAKTLHSLEGAIREIQREAEIFGFLQPSNVQAAFPDQGPEKEQIYGMFLQWEKDLQPQLDISLHELDVQKAEDALDGLSVMNARFLKLISRRHKELVKNDVNKALESVNESYDE